MMSLAKHGYEHAGKLSLLLILSLMIVVLSHRVERQVTVWNERVFGK